MQLPPDPLRLRGAGRGRALPTFNSALIGGAVKAKIRFAGPLRGGRGLDEMRSEIDFEAAISRASATELGEL